LEELYENYKDRANFVLVIVHEAGHSQPGLEFLLKDQDPDSRRVNVAEAMRIMHVTIPAVLDTPDFRMERAFRSGPMRVVGVNHGELLLDQPFRPSTGIDFVQLKGWLDAALQQPGRPMM
jgi:hypothetical protein